MTVRLAKAIAVAVVVAFALAALTGPGTNWWLRDADAYWDAALRLRGGEPLYPALANVEDPDIYRYSPWFAVAWMPLTFLPHDLVRVIWGAVLVMAAIACVVPAVRTRTLAGSLVALLLGAVLIRTASSGNVQPLMLAALIWGVERRSGPLWIAAAASLKAVPLLYVAVYAARREWSRVAVTLLLTAVFVAPMLLFDLADYPFEAGSLVDAPISAPWAWVVVAGALFAVFRLRSRPQAWIAASIAVLFALPRWVPYFPTWFLVGTETAGRPPAVPAQRAGSAQDTEIREDDAPQADHDANGNQHLP